MKILVPPFDGSHATLVMLLLRVLWTDESVHVAQRGDACSEFASPSLSFHQLVRDDIEGESNIFHRKYGFSKDVVSLLHGRCILTHVHFKYEAISDPASDCWYLKPKSSVTVEL